MSSIGRALGSALLRCGMEYGGVEEGKVETEAIGDICCYEWNAN